MLMPNSIPTKAPEEYLIRYRPVMYPDGLEESTLGLHFRASHAHFPQGSMSLRCTAVIGVFYEQKEEDSDITHFPPLSLKSREHTYGKVFFLFELTLFAF